jgi:hypothetical protein
MGSHSINLQAKGRTGGLSMDREARRAILGRMVLLGVSFVIAVDPVVRIHSRPPRVDFQQYDRAGPAAGPECGMNAGSSSTTDRNSGTSERIVPIQYYNPPAVPPQYSYRPAPYPYPASPYQQYQPPPEAPKATTCVTSAGQCGLNPRIYLPIGSSCTCSSPYGTYFGVAR